MIDGAKAVRLARAAIRSQTSGEDLSADVPDGFAEPSGVFVTLKTYPGGELRGCIGYPEPFFPMYEALIRSAGSACHDPRFPELRYEELDRITVEVTILTVPERMEGTKDEIMGNVVIGRDGLILEARGRRGLLLPQVPAEWGWGITEYLENLSMKAGLERNAWKDDDAVIYRFEGTVFREDSPNGNVVRA